MLRRHRQKVNFHIQRNETDRLEKNGIDGDAAIAIVSNGIQKEEREGGKKKREEKRTSVQYSITQIDIDKSNRRSTSLFFFFFLLLLCTFAYKNQIKFE